MNYPRKLQILIIEDEHEPIVGYQKLLETFQETYPHSPPLIARSLSDAKRLLAEPHPFHLVILDLNLPLESREAAPEGVAPGQQLLDLLASREAYPVPVLLVVTGKGNRLDMGPFLERLRRDFWYGQMVNKGIGQSEAIESGIQKALQYCDVGIHIQDGGRRWFPTLSPREVDLLRRCILAQENCLGVDLEWWAAEQGPSANQPNPDAGPTKVLIGSFLLDGGVGRSHPTFFKFEPAGNAPYVARDVGIFAHKLPHVNRLHAGCSHLRSLLVTPSATGNRPVSLDAFLHDRGEEAAPFIPDLVADIVGQLDRLCITTDQQLPANQAFLWKPLHDAQHRRSVREFWNKENVRELARAGHTNPITAMETLATNSTLMWIKQRACTHGDLNASNVAIDPGAPSRPRAFIFDPGGVHADHEFRDLACLEVTALLFSADPSEGGLVSFCRGYYEDALGEKGISIPDKASPYAKNVIRLIQAIRAHVAASPDPNTYSLLLFDATLRQLFGLAFQAKRNKVVYPIHACYLAAWAAEWAARQNPSLFTAHT